MVLRVRLRPFAITLLLLLGVFCLYLGFNNMSHWGQQDNGEPKQTQNALTVTGPTPISTSFFVTYRQNRENTRQQQIDLLNGLIDGTNTTPDTRKQAQQELLRVVQNIAKESQVEGLVLAKGFKDVAAQMNDNSLNLMVYGDQFSAAEITQLQDIAVRATGLRLDNIIIVPRK
ncbi:MAG: SpoIIIAH-like family protein [Peptococcaceae bacterium]|nr:SpoIIIAH-like family protein [Peptococcaceae bacterium]